jgi:hypothetical protein
MTEDHGPFSGLRVPAPDEGLESRALGAARAALDEEPVTVWDRLTASRPLRVAWGAVTAALLIAHLALSLRVHPSAPTESLWARWSEAEALGEAGRLPEAALGARARAVMLDTTSSRGVAAGDPAPDHDNGSSS